MAAVTVAVGGLVGVGVIAAAPASSAPSGSAPPGAAPSGEAASVDGAVLVAGATFDDQTLGTGLTQSGGGAGTLTYAAQESGYALQVNDRSNDYTGIQTAPGLLTPGTTYTVSAQVRLVAGAPATQIRWVSFSNDGADHYGWIGNADVTDAAWTTIAGEWTVPPGSDPATAKVYIGAGGSGTYSYLVDDVEITTSGQGQLPVDTSLTPLKDTIDIPGLGVAIDSRETTGDASTLLLHHFNQITPENHMKVEAWYDADHTFRRHPEATALLDYAVAHDLRLYGHVLVWHSQTPDWFFQREDGTPLTTSEADKQFLRDRLRTHIENVAASIAGDYGPFGSDTNPMVGIDAVNEVVSDANEPGDGLRRSPWYNLLGEEFISLAFRYADEAFNHTYAADGTDRPVALFINDYNTEQSAKQDRYYALVQRLLAAGVPVDGVGHQFHSSLATPVSSLDAALTRFADLPVVQAVTELDVTIGTPVTQANLVKQGHWYQEAFDVFRTHAQDLFSVTVWGLTDNRSWRAEQAPVLFDAGLQAKQAYVGAAGGEVDPLVTTANVFGGDVALDSSAGDAVEWRNLPAQPLTGGAGSFVPRWTADHLTLLVSAASDTSDAVEVTLDGATAGITKAGAVSGGAQGVVIDDDGEGWRAVLRLPLDGAVAGGSAQLDVRVTAAGSVVGAWNSPGSTGTLTFLEDLSTLDVVEASQAPVVDGIIDAAWAEANEVTTGKTVEGAADGATATVRTLWHGDDTLYVLAEVTDPVIDVSSGDPWVQDSVELFLDLGNVKGASYGPNDAQFRVSVDNVRSFGTGDAAAQDARLTSATARTATGYVVELAVSLRGQSGGQDDVPFGGPDTFLGLDFQVNDGRDGARYSVHTWADPTGTGYQSAARWGVGHLVATAEPVPPLTADQLTNALRGGVAVPGQLSAGGTAILRGLPARTEVAVWFYGAGGAATLTEGTTSAAGAITVPVPADATVGKHKVAVFAPDGTLLGWNEARVR